MGSQMDTKMAVESSNVATTHTLANTSANALARIVGIGVRMGLIFRGVATEFESALLATGRGSLSIEFELK